MGDFDELEGHDPALEEVVAEPVKEDKVEEKPSPPKKADDKK